MITPTLEPSVTSWQRERDAMLDRISHLQDARDRATDFLARLAGEVSPITAFDMGEAIALLWETPEQSEARRFAGVLDSETPDPEEDHE